MPNIVSFSKVAFFCGLLGILGTVEYVIILYVSGAQLIAGDKLAGLHTMSDKVGDANNSIGMWLALEAHSMQADRIQLEDSEENGQREAARMNMKVPSPSRIRCWMTIEPLVECLQRPARKLTGYEKSGNDIMFTLRSTVKFHEERLPVLFKTWLSTVNLSNVFLVTDGKDDALERKAANEGKYVATLHDPIHSHIP